MKLKYLLFILVPLVAATACKKKNNPAADHGYAGEYKGTYNYWSRKMDTTGKVTIDSAYKQYAVGISNVGNDSFRITADFMHLPKQVFAYSNDNHYYTSIAGSHFAEAYDIYIKPGERSVYIVNTSHNQGMGNGAYFLGYR